LPELAGARAIVVVSGRLATYYISRLDVKEGRRGGYRRRERPCRGAELPESTNHYQASGRFIIRKEKD